MNRKRIPRLVTGEKLVTASEMARVEQKSLKEGGGSAAAYMEQAAKGIAEFVSSWVGRFTSVAPPIYLICGKGNNGGDAYAAGEYLLAEGFEVSAFSLFPLKETSPLCHHHAMRFCEKGGRIIEVKRGEEIDIPETALVLDGIFGTGFSGKTEGLVYEVIERLNALPSSVIAIDIPSGVSGDTGEVKGNAIIADATLYLGAMKVGHLYGEGFPYVGELVFVDFGMQEAYKQELEPFAFLVNPEILQYNRPQHKRTSHKYEVGEVVLLGGSRGMAGAALIGAHAALRCGAGIVRLFHEQGIEQELSQGALEIVRVSYERTELTPLFEELKRAKALLVGPGLGRKEGTKDLLEEIYQKANLPLVLDADALFFLDKPPPGSILTPHRGELLHLLKGEASLSALELIARAEAYAKEHRVTLVFKGAPTTILSPDQPKIVIPFGHEGMASGGMGDALSGIIASLLAQGKTPYEAAALGALIHAEAGKLAMQEVSPDALLVSDLIHALPDLFLKLNFCADHE